MSLLCKDAGQVTLKGLVDMMQSSFFHRQVAAFVLAQRYVHNRYVFEVIDIVTHCVLYCGLSRSPFLPLYMYMCMLINFVQVDRKAADCFGR